MRFPLCRDDTPLHPHQALMPRHLITDQGVVVPRGLARRFLRSSLAECRQSPRGPLVEGGCSMYCRCLATWNHTNICHAHRLLTKIGYHKKFDLEQEKDNYLVRH